MFTPKDKTNSAQIWYQVARNVVAVASLFNFIVCILIIAHYMQIRLHHPINSTVLEKLIKNANEHPENHDLRDEVRTLDLLARKAYFTNQWQIRTGGFILLGGVLVLLIGLKYMNAFRRNLPNLESSQSHADSWEKKILSGKFVLGIYVALIIISLIFIVLSYQELREQNLYFAEQAKSVAEAGESYPIQEEINSNWPNFRGPGGLGIAFVNSAPLEWDGRSGKNIIWKTAVPKPGFNSPIYWRGKIFLSGADESGAEVYCFDANAGALLWQREANHIPGSPDKMPKVIKDTGYAAPTMATNGQLVFALFANGNIICFDYEGKRSWARNLGVPENQYGHASSLITFQNLVLIQYDHFANRSIMALDAKTGRTVWQTSRPVEISWASPILVNTSARIELVLNANPIVAAYDPSSGKELWHFKCMSGEVGASPAYANGIVFVAIENARLAAIKIGEKPEKIWEYENGLPEASSPLATDHYLFMATSWGLVSCLEAKDGKLYWEHEFKEGFYSSPILAGLNVYLVDRKGTTQIFKADKEFQLIGSNELGEKSDCIPAFVSERIYIRGEKHLFCIGK